MEVNGSRFLVFRSGLEHFFSPPFDTISRAEEAVLKSFPYNITHLTLPLSIEETRIEFEGWKNESILQRLPDEAVFVIEQRFMHGGLMLRRVGVICLVRVFPLSSDIKPHELTFPGPRKGRHNLMAALGCQPEPIFLITPAKGLSPSLEEILRSGKKTMIFEEPAGVTNTIYVADSPDALGRLRNALEGESAIVADGHHRLAAVREIAEEHSAQGDPSWNYVLAYVTSTGGDGLLIGGIHRVVRAPQGREFSISDIREYFDLADSPPGTGKREIVVYDGRMRYATPNRAALSLDEKVDFSVAPDVVNSLIFRKCLKMTDAEIESLVTYTHDADFARSAVDEGSASFSILLPEWDPEEFARKVSGGQLLPQKSTFFYPKVPSGIALFEPGMEQSG